MSRPEIPFAELAVTTNFSFLHGAAHPQDYVVQAAAYGLSAIGIADRNTVAGVVRAHAAARALEAEGTKIRILPGVRLVTEEGFEAVTYPMDRAAWGRLCRLLTLGNRRVRKGECRFAFAEMLEAAKGQMFIAMPPARRLPEGFRSRLEALAAAAPGRTFLGASHTRRGDERRRLGLLAELGAAARAPMVAVSDALYHHPERRPLQDVVTCIRAGCRIGEAGYRLEANAERHLKPPRRDGAAVRRPPGGGGPHRRDRRGLRLLPVPAALRISRRAGAPGARRRNTWRRRPSSGRTGATAAIFPPPSRGRSARSCGSSPRWTMPVTS